MLLDEKPVRLAKAENYQAIHLMVPRRGVAVHINAFNFPSWGLWEKAAVALIAGVPVLAKPASATALLAHAMVQRRDRGQGAAGWRAEHSLRRRRRPARARSTSDDVVAFTGSADTAARVRGHANVVARSVPVNIEADSINAALLAPDAAPGGAALDAFLREVVREMTVKAGQKCTAIRRIFVPPMRPTRSPMRLRQSSRAPRSATRAQADTRMGPVVTRAPAGGGLRGHPPARRRRRGRLRRRASAPSRRHRRGAIGIRRADLAAGQGCRQRAGRARGRSVRSRRHRRALSRRGGGCVLIARGGGSLVASLYADERDFLLRMVSEIGSGHGRILAVDPAIAAAHSGHGIVMPQCNHGGPGRAGAGEELGGAYGLRFYHQRLAVQGSSDLLAGLQAQGGELALEMSVGRSSP